MNQIIPVQILSLVPYVNNARTHSDEQIAMIAASLHEFGWTNPILIDKQKGIIAGHGRLLAARKIQNTGSSIPNWNDLSTVPTIELSSLSESQKRAYIIADNKLAERAGWDKELLSLELGSLKTDGFDLDLLGFDNLELDDLLKLDSDLNFGDKTAKQTKSLAERFMVVPFSVLNAREGWWQDRKKSWLSLGLKSEEGRDENLAYSKSSQPPKAYSLKNEYETKIGHSVTWEEFAKSCPEAMTMSGTSVFDPVLCELAYRWFCPTNGVILDPFAGGSVRGIVASKLGLQYVGCDLRQEQVQANREQWNSICGDIAGDDNEVSPIWHCGDSRLIDKHAEGVKADFIFSCPPYADLEVYSDNPDDLSTMDYPSFLIAYREIINKTVSMLKQDRFACFIVGDVRDKNGFYYNFVGDTVQAFVDAGAKYYNKAILVTQAGSLAIRAGKTFSASRKLGKTHQNVLVFCKGNPKQATEACGIVDVELPEGLNVV